MEKEKPQQDGRKGKITFRLKPHSCQRHSEGSNKPSVRQDSEIQQRLSQNCLSISCGGMGLQWPATGVWGSGCSRPGYGISPLGGGHHQSHQINSTNIATRTYIGLEKQALGEHKQNLMHTRTQEKGALTLQETEPGLPVSVWESPVEAWDDSGLSWGQGH